MSILNMLLRQFGLFLTTDEQMKFDLAFIVYLCLDRRIKQLKSRASLSRSEEVELNELLRYYPELTHLYLDTISQKFLNDIDLVLKKVNSEVSHV